MQPKTVFLSLFLWVLSFFLGIFVNKNQAWLHTLEIPDLAPSSSLFAVMWIAVHSLLTASALSLGEKMRTSRTKTITLYMLFTLFAAGIAWLPLSLILHSLTFSWCWILGLNVVGAITLIFTARSNILSGVLMTPYILYITFVAVLTHSTVVINPPCA